MIGNHLLNAVSVCESIVKLAGGVGGNGYKLAACIFDKRRIYGAAPNTYKTHPLMLKYGNYPHLHAEVHACIRVGLNNCSGKSIYVHRILKNGQPGNSKPCPSCQKFLKHAGINTVYYRNELGYIDWLKL